MMWRRKDSQCRRAYADEVNRLTLFSNFCVVKLLVLKAFVFADYNINLLFSILITNLIYK